MSRRRIGRVKVDFAVIEECARNYMANHALFVLHDSWTLSRKSALHRRKDGSYTFCLIWKLPEGPSLSHTIRGVRLDRTA